MPIYDYSCPKSNSNPKRLVSGPLDFADARASGDSAKGKILKVRPGTKGRN